MTRGNRDGSSVVRYAAARMGCQWCGARRHDRVCHRGMGTQGGRSQRRVYCREVAWRGKEHPSTLPLLSASIVRTHSAEQPQPGASPRAQPIYIASGTPHNPSTPGLNRVTGHDGRGRDNEIAISINLRGGKGTAYVGMHQLKWLGYSLHHCANKLLCAFCLHTHITLSFVVHDSDVINKSS